MEPIDITPETILAICTRIEALLRGRPYRTFDGKRLERHVWLRMVARVDDGLRIVDSEGVLSVYTAHGPASITFDDLGFTLNYTSLGGHPCVCIYTVEVEE